MPKRVITIAETRTGLAQAPEANLFTGALTTGIKIDVPAGRKNMTPNLTLQYSSAGGPGPFGYGWDLPIGRIERSTKWGVPNCRAHTDDFVLVLPTTTVELVPESAGSNIFRPRIEEAYVKAERNPTGNYWTVTDRAGLKYTFGSADANFQGNGGADSARVANHTTTPLKFFSASPTCEFTSIWALTKIEDGSTNIVRNVWHKYDNVLYPKEILYGGNGQVSGPLYKVRFGSAANPVLAEDRPAGDWLTSYRNGVAAKVTKRITRITVESMVSEQPGVIRTYTLTYKDNPAGAGPDGYRSLLSRVSTEAQPTLDLVYKPSVNAHATTTTARPANAYGKMRVANSSQEVQQTVLDMNGDGILDVVRTDYYPVANKLWAVWFGTGNGVGFGTQTTWAVPFGGMPLRDVAATGGNVNSDTFDITGDGIPDWVDAQAVPWKVYPGKLMSGQWKFDPTYITWQNTPFLYLRSNNTDGDTIQDLIDMNADGRPDLVYSKPGQGGPSSSWTWDVYYNTGSGFESTTPVLFSAPTRLITDVTSPAGCAAKHAVMDFNADGLPDLVNVGTPDATNGWPYDTRCSPSSSQLAFCLEVRHNTGQGFASTPHLMAIPPQVTSCGALCFTPVLNLQAASCDTTTKTVLRDYFDVNGDGVPDWVSKDGSSSQWKVLLNLGSSFETLSYTGPVLPNIYAGEATRVWAGATGALRHYIDNDTAIDLMDFNGDGLLDQVDWGNGTTWTVRLNNPTTGVPAATTERPNLLVTLQNGLGGTSYIFYKPSTAYDNTGTGTGADSDLQPDLPFNTWVVDGIRRTSGQCTATVTNPLDPTNPCLGNGTTTFGHDLVAKVTYQDGRFDSAAREFRGFRQVTRRTIEGPTGGSNDTRTIFGQEDATKGRVLSVHTYAGAATGDATQRVRLEENFWNTSALPNNRTKVWLAKNTRLTSDYPAAAQPHYVETVNDTVDTYGNITQHHTVGTDLTARVDTYIVYAVPQTGTLFPIYDRPARAWVQDASGVLEEKWFTYDGLAAGQVGAGNLTRMQARRTPTDANGPVVTTVYDTYGNATSITDPNGNVTTQAYTDSAKLYPNVVTRVRPPPKQNLVTTTVIDYFYGQPKMVTDPNGAISEYRYDQAGRNECIKRPLDTDPCTIQYTYNLTPTPPPVGQPWPLASVRMRELQDVPKPELWTQHYFDGLGRPRYSDTFRVVDGLDQTVRSGQTDYDGGGRPARIQTAFVLGTTPDANDLTKFDYHLNGSATYIDPLGRAWRTTAVDGGVSEQQFAGVVTTAIDPEGTKTATTVDAFGRVKKTEVYQGAAVYMTTEYTYDGVGREKSVKLNGTTLKTVSYDSLGRKTSMTDVNTGSGTTAGTWSYNYDMNGNLIRQNDPKTNQQTQRCYNDLNQVTRDCPIASDTTTLVPCEITCGHPEEVDYFYDEVLESGSKALGRLTSVEDASGRTEFRKYDLRGRVEKLKRIFNSGGSPHGGFETNYDLNDRVRWTKYPDGEIVNTDYDRSGQPIALWSTAEVYVDTAEYDRFGRLKKLAHSNGVTDTRTYHTLAEGHRLKNVKSGTASATYLNFDLADYNKRGQIKAVTDFRNGTGGLSLQGTYTYDFMGRLDYFQSNWPNATEDYAYDSFNRITLLGSRTFTYSATKPHQVSSIVDGGVSKTVTHDNNGNRSNKENTDYTYTYDVEDRPARVNAPNGDVDFIYDYTGQKRVETDSTNPMSVVTTRYYSALTATKTTGTGTPITYKWYYLGGVRVAAKTVMGAPWETTSLFDDFVRFAKVRAEQPALVVHLEGGAPIALGALALGLTAALLLAPWRRREVIVGLRLRHGQVTGVTLLWLLATLPWPIILLPSAAGAQGASAVHFHLDHLGSTLAISGPGPAGSLQEEIRYRPYGDERWRMPSGGSFHGPDYEFTGYETQANIDLYYAKARFYDPVMGAFLTHDPAAQFANPYTYTAWDPVNRTDPSGMLTGTEWLIIAVIAMSAASAIDTLANGGSPLDALKAGVIAGATTAVGGATLGCVLGPAIEAGGAAGVAAVSFIVASAGYGAYQAVESGYYASLITGIVLFAIGAARIRESWGTAGAKATVPQGPRGGTGGGLSRVGGELENVFQRAGDYLDYFNPFNKSQIQPGTPQYEKAQSAINEIPYRPTRGALLGRLEGGHLYTYTRIFGGADALTVGGDTFISTGLLGQDPSYVGFQLSHEYFHQLSWGLTGGPGGEWMAHRFAVASNPLGVQAVQAIELQYPSVIDLYRGLMTQAGGAP